MIALAARAKTPYAIPTMTEINAIQWNGFKVASTFSGCGGSCLGYRMAGFKVVWANEFVPIARASYAANSSPDCFVDPRDIKHVEAQDILNLTGLKPGELDLFDGSPPCQAFSTAGKREKSWGKAKQYEHGAKQCNETLFAEYIRLLKGLQPKVFVAENVSGLVRGTAKGMFLEILRDLKASGYNVKCKLLDAKWLGVPQSRLRTIFIGVRNDMDREPVHPKPLTYFYSVCDALPSIIRSTEDPKGQFSIRTFSNQPHGTITTCNSNHIKVEVQPTSCLKEDMQPCKTVTTDDSFGIRGIVKRKFTIAEVKRICSFPDDFILIGSYVQQWERLGNSVPPLMMRSIAEVIRDQILRKVQPC